MVDEVSSEALGEFHRHRVADLSGLGDEAPGQLERVGEGLETGRFAGAQGPVLLGVAEPPVAVADAPGGERGSGPIPSEPPVDVGVSLEVSAVAVGPEVLGPVEPVAALGGLADAPEVQVGQHGGSVAGDRGVFLARIDRRERPDPLPDRGMGRCRVRPVSRGREFDGAEATGQEHESAPCLRDAVVGAGDRRMHNGVRGRHLVDELFEGAVGSLQLLEAGDILHEDQLGLKLPDEPKELAQEGNPVVFIRLVFLMPGERLARGASREQPERLPARLKRLAHLGGL